MKKVLFTIAMMLLPMLASAEAVEIDGIYYNLDSESKTAAVTKNPDNYQGDVTIPESFEYSGTTYSVTSIGDYAFYQCSGLTSVSMPDGVTSIGRSAFEKCSGLTSVNIPNSVTTIGRYAFWECSSLSAITIPNSVGTIGYRTFSDCNGLTSVIIENGVTTIDDHAFWGCSSLTTITIPSSVTSIGMASFGQCIRLATVTIGSSTSSIGYHAFEECTSLTSIIVDETNQTFKSVDGVLISKNGTTILTYPAGKTETAYIIPSGVTSIGESAFYGCGGLTSVIIPDGVTSIGIGAFSGCSGLTSVIIPGGVTTIGGGAFADCSSLTSITVDESNPNYKSEDGVLLSKDGTTLITYPIGKTGTAYIISDGVTTIDYSAFRGCSGLISVTIPSSMTSIGYHAFYGCSGLTSVTIPGSVTAIGDWAFAFCNSLTSITIGSGVTAIGGWAFYGCTDLSDVFCYAKDVPTTDNRAFSNSNVANATLHVPEGAVEAYKAAEPWNQFKEIVVLDEPDPVMGDMDGDGLVDSRDVVALVKTILSGDFSVAGEWNDDGKMDISDVVMLVNYIMEMQTE
ncbi:MAG: leucine-rich repeat protein [Prevotella sp.]|nr:leucine-rich repeat protein [Prevotella sp.]